MTRSHDTVPHPGLASAQEYITLPELQPALHQFHSFYARYALLGDTIKRHIDDYPVDFSTVASVKMTREKQRTALVLLEDDGGFNNKRHRLFTHQLGGETIEYRITAANMRIDGHNHTGHREYYSVFHAEAVMPDVSEHLKRGVLRLGTSALSANHWTIDGQELNLEDISRIRLPDIDSFPAGSTNHQR